MPEQTYPTPLHSQSYDTGPRYMKYLKVRKDWDSVTITSKFEDGGIDTNLISSTPVQEYRLSYDGLTDEDANILDQFWEQHGRHTLFTFIEPRDHPSTGVEGSTVTGCRFISYDKDHEKVKGIQKREVVIGKYPS